MDYKYIGAVNLFDTINKSDIFLVSIYIKSTASLLEDTTYYIHNESFNKIDNFTKVDLTSKNIIHCNDQSIYCGIGDWVVYSFLNINNQLFSGNFFSIKPLFLTLLNLDTSDIITKLKLSSFLKLHLMTFDLVKSANRIFDVNNQKIKIYVSGFIKTSEYVGLNQKTLINILNNKIVDHNIDICNYILLHKNRIHFLDYNFGIDEFFAYVPSYTLKEILKNNKYLYKYLLFNPIILNQAVVESLISNSTYSHGIPEGMENSITEEVVNAEYEIDSLSKETRLITFSDEDKANLLNWSKEIKANFKLPNTWQSN